MIGAVEVLFKFFFKGMVGIKGMIKENVLHILDVRLSEAEVLADWPELGQKAQKVEKVAQR